MSVEKKASVYPEQPSPIYVTDPYSGQTVNVEPLFRLIDERTDEVIGATGLTVLQVILEEIAYALNLPFNLQKEDVIRMANFNLVELNMVFRAMKQPRRQ